jgi:hypothetical protein
MHTLIQAASIRVLQHVAEAPAPTHADHDHHGHAHADEHEHEHGEATAGGLSALDLRLLAMAVILVGGLAGVVPPIMGRWLASPDSITGRAVRAFSGGAILGLALVGVLLLRSECLAAAINRFGIKSLSLQIGLHIICDTFGNSCTFRLHKAATKSLTWTCMCMHLIAVTK